MDNTSPSEPKNLGGRPCWEPTAEDTTTAERLAGFGLPHHMIALIIGISEHTLRKYLSDALKMGEARATSKVAETLFNRATIGKDLGAAIFWLKARAGWREKQPEPQEPGGATVTIVGGLPE